MGARTQMSLFGSLVTLTVNVFALLACSQFVIGVGPLKTGGSESMLSALQLPWGTPWLDLGLGFRMRCLFNGALFALFGGMHTLMAQRSTKIVLGRYVHPASLRTLFMLATGLLMTVLVYMWQPSDCELWDARESLGRLLGASEDSVERGNKVVSVMLFAGMVWSVMLHDPLSFGGTMQAAMGVADKYGNMPGEEEGSMQLIATGLYGIVRHPMYMFTELALVSRVTMPWDRFWFFVLSMLYLMWAVPIEELKLIDKFGDSYVEYRKRVWAVIPGVF